MSIAKDLIVKDWDILNFTPFRTNSVERLEPKLHDPFEPTTKDKSKSGMVKSFFLLLNAALGVGVLHMSSAIHDAGYIPSIIVSPFVIALEHYCLSMLMNIMTHVAHDRNNFHTVYEDCVYVTIALGPKFLRKFAQSFRFALRILIVLYSIGMAAVAIIYISRTMTSVVPLHADLKTSMRYYVILQLLPLVGINCIRNHNVEDTLGYLSLVLTFFLLVFITYVAHNDADDTELSYKQFGTLNEVPMIIASTLLVYECINEILIAEEHIKNPEDFRGFFGSLSYAMFIAIPIYIFMGVFGYVKYGEYIKPSLLSSLSYNRYSNICRVTLVIFVMASFPQQCYQVLNTGWFHWLEKLMSNGKYQRFLLLMEYLIRIFTTLLAALIAYGYPNFELVLETVAAFYISIIVCFFPALMDFAYSWRMAKKRKRPAPYWIMVKDVLIMIVAIGIAVLVTPVIIAEKQ